MLKLKFELWTRPGLVSFNFKKHQTTSKQHPNNIQTRLMYIYIYIYRLARGGGETMNMNMIKCAKES